MKSSALLVSDDLIFRGEARGMLNELHIDCVRSGTVGFKKALIAAKFDAVVVDYSSARETVEAIRHVRTGKINRYSIIFGACGRQPNRIGSTGRWSEFHNSTLFGCA